jgi:hypothetical protein
VNIHGVDRDVLTQAGEQAYGFMENGVFHTPASKAVAKGWVDGYCGRKYDPCTYDDEGNPVPMGADVVAHYALYYAQAQGRAEQDIRRENEKRAREGRRTLPSWRVERVVA